MKHDTTNKCYCQYEISTKLKSMCSVTIDVRLKEKKAWKKWLSSVKIELPLIQVNRKDSITMKHDTTNKRYCPHEISTKIHSVQVYRQTKDISYVCRRYHISKASLMRWNRLYDGTRESLMPKSHRPHTGIVKKSAVEKSPKRINGTDASEFTKWSVAERRKFGCGAPRGGHTAFGMLSLAHSRYATGGSPPGLNEVTRIRL